MTHAERRDQLRRLFDPNFDVLLISSAVNVRYLTGFTGGASYLLLGKNDEILVSDGRFTQQLADEAPGLKTHIRPVTETTPNELAKVIEKLGYQSIAIEARSLTVAELEALKAKIKSADWISTSGLVEQLRAIKDAGELATLKKAIATAESAYQEFRQLLQPNDDEFDFSNRIEFLIRKHGGQKTSFEPIMAVGERSALAHAPPTARKVSSGSWLLVDWGAIVDGYYSDLTRILIPHTPSIRSSTAPQLDLERLRPAYQAVRNAQEAAIALLRPGVKAKDVDAAARASLTEAGYGEFFTHGLGHGIGLEIHESPHLRASSDETLTAGMVVTVEPGVYFPDWGGIRIEDDVVITEDGPLVLSNLPRELDDAFL